MLSCLGCYGPSKSPLFLRHTLNLIHVNLHVVAENSKAYSSKLYVVSLLLKFSVENPKLSVLWTDIVWFTVT